jgi:hypothetical protein
MYRNACVVADPAACWLIWRDSSRCVVQALLPMFRRLGLIPFYVLAATGCPPGIEATLFAVFTALNSFGIDMGR